MASQKTKIHLAYCLTALVLAMTSFAAPVFVSGKMKFCHFNKAGADSFFLARNHEPGMAFGITTNQFSASLTVNKDDIAWVSFEDDQIIFKLFEKYIVLKLPM